VAKTKQTDFTTILVTGGSDGLGRAAAVLLASSGYRVFAGGRDQGKLAKLRQWGVEQNLALETVQLDVQSGNSIDRAISEIESRAGRIDVLINNAGIAVVAALEEVSMEDLQRQFDTNVFGAVRVTQRVLPGMRRRMRGRIINMSSVMGKVTHPLWGPYCASKHALEAISDALRLELYQFGIDVVVIEPGYIPTNIKQTTAELSSRYEGAAGGSPYASLYQRLLTSWLQSDETAATTPEDCASIILRAIEASRPKTRYPVTRTAKVWTLAKRVLPDRVMDRRFRKSFGIARMKKAAEQSA
jgi:NAD(P)-dependent dehydrogenase (short-subunit alcohol dehydrogenase family)